MIPQNSPERKKAFTRFIILYIITTGIVVVAIYFGIQVPFQQNKKLQEQLASIEKERDFGRSFFAQLGEAKGLLDSVNKPGVQAELVDGQIDSRLQQLTAMVDKDSVSEKRLYQELIKTYFEIKDDKKRIRASGDKDAQAAEFESQLAQWKAKYDDCRNTYSQLLTQYNMSMKR
ncbi:type VI secretion system TssO [Taibaiella koreensis]|uniref:type VI secretion system TssO n=1 Tax=Taibaiella koreensis TaxID=1268548 RepID=UPI000E5A0C2F|nr:type VI secretion system TssO [Taibaiella koreensis]